MTNITVRLREKLREDLDALCREQDRPASEVVRDSLRRYLAAQELRRLRRKLRPHAEARGFLTDEDVFKAVS